MTLCEYSCESCYNGHRRTRGRMTGEPWNLPDYPPEMSVKSFFGESRTWHIPDLFC